MDRVLQSTVSTASITFYIDGVPAPPVGNAATVTITRVDGTEIATDAATQPGVGSSFSYTLSATELAELGPLRLDWTAEFAVGGSQTLTTRVEVVGGYLFSLADARRDQDLTNTTDYPTERIVEARTVAEQALEKACGVAFVPRYNQQTISGTGDMLVSGLAWPAIRTFRSVVVDGTAFTSEQLALVDSSGLWTYYPNRFARGHNNIVVGYEHGYDEPDGEVSRACLRLAKHYLVDSSQDDRALRIDTESGSMVISTPGMRGQRFGIPEVDAVVRAHAYPQPMVA